MSESAKAMSSPVASFNPAIIALSFPVRPAGGWPEKATRASSRNPAARRFSRTACTTGMTGSVSSSKTKIVSTGPG